MRGGAVQGEQRVIGVRAVQCWDVPEHQRGDGVRDVPIGEPVELAEGQLGSRGLPLQFWLQRSERGTLRSVLARNVQGGEWVVRVYGMCCGDVSQRERGDRV